MGFTAIGFRKDIRAYKFQPADPATGRPFRWIRNNKQAKRARTEGHETLVKKTRISEDYTSPDENEE
ncbi:hypothetical protein OESDEN_21419 [Oesophagostomum dentatum]|uniref:Uncharacterized protein n=1 Tax=Oesophagostomum dentatum TaxID=61180 RepID=A0A0B1S4Z8_OESDE|nr:hypothetical protein OESDEN_21419 [Oesophagostomum dentatum]